MTDVRRLLVLLVFTVFAAVSSASAANAVYIAPASAGGNTGADCADAKGYSYFNSSNNWSSSPSGVLIGPGTTVHVCSGTYSGSAGSTALTFQRSGASGNPVTLLFDQGPVTFTAPYWSGSSGAISAVSGLSYIVICGAAAPDCGADGKSNLTITNSSNGTNQNNQQQSFGIELPNCTHCTVENVTITNIYVNNGSSSSANDTNGANTSCIEFDSAATSSIAAYNTVSQCKTGIAFQADPSDASNVVIHHNMISDMDWGIHVGGGDVSTTINNLSIHDNTITNWANWLYPTGSYHQDGIIIHNSSSAGGIGSQTLTAMVYNNYAYGPLGNGPEATGFLFCSYNSQCTVFNNVFIDTGSGHIYGMIWLISNLAGHRVFNNTIIGAGGGDICITFGTAATNNNNAPAIVENNICTGGLSLFGTYSSSLSEFEGVMQTSNYNDSYGNANALYGISNYFTTSYAAWQAAGYDANSTTGNPSLNTNAPPYTITSGSAAAGLGTNLTSLGIAALDVSAPLTFGAGGSCGSQCGQRPSSGTWDTGAYNLSSSTSTGGPPAPPTDLNAVVK